MSSIPKEPVPIALSFQEEDGHHKITSITTAPPGSDKVDFADGCTLGMWVEITKYKELVEKAWQYDELCK